MEKLRHISQTIASTRPTARNLFQAIDRMQAVAEAGSDIDRIKKALVDEAVKIHTEETEATRKLSQLGAELINDNSTILTHCNTGPLATAGYGTALGVIIYAREQGKYLHELTLDEYRRFSQDFEDDVFKIDLESSVAARDVPGGTAPRRVEEVLKAARRLLEESRGG